ncbi:MAG TPA: TIM barrel protein [Thermoplasmata archaeon]|nr:TIM barrel protein [Thermoplasmata archaeon]
MNLGTTVSADDFDDLAIEGSEFSVLLLFDGDLERLLDGRFMDRLIDASPPIKYVHVQEFVNHDGDDVLVDLSSEDEPLRRRSVQIVAATRSIAHDLHDSLVVFHPGGVRRTTVDRQMLLSNLEKSLRELSPSSLLMENLPWYYWYKKRERFVSNICVSIEDMARFMNMVEGFTLDICHGYLSVPEGDPNYCTRFMDAFGGKVAHIHASDAKAPDKEGLQIGEGDVDFSSLIDVDVPIIAEVWNGHANGGEGFRIAIERLRSLERLDD